MIQNAKNSRVKGFTLTEMVVVLAIIGILLGILMPSMMAYYRNSRVKAANSDAKMVYNAVQTEVMRYMTSDRTTPHTSGFAGGMWVSYEPSGKISIAAGPDVPGSLTETSASDTEETNPEAAAARDVVDRVNRMVYGANEICWSVYVNNYIVQACVAANVPSTKYVGFYSANKQSADPSEKSGSYSTVYLTRLDTARTHYAGKKSTANEDKKP